MCVGRAFVYFVFSEMLIGIPSGEGAKNRGPMPAPCDKTGLIFKSQSACDDDNALLGFILSREKDWKWWCVKANAGATKAVAHHRSKGLRIRNELGSQKPPTQLATSGS